MKKLSLRPYHGAVWVCENAEELSRVYKRLCARPYPYQDDPNGGRYVKIEGATVGDTKWLVYAADLEALAHELAHVLLQTFGSIGHNPTEGDGEPFCYMLSQLIHEARQMSAGRNKNSKTGARKQQRAKAVSARAERKQKLSAKRRVARKIIKATLKG